MNKKNKFRFIRRSYEVIKIVLIIVLPFILLIRGAIFAHVKWAMWPWASIAVGVVFSALLLIIYFSYFYKGMGGSYGSTPLKRNAIIALVFVCSYVIHGIFFLAVSSMPNEAMEKEIRKTHPIIRLSISTLVQMDKDLIIIDAHREPGDYKKMGQKTKAFSLHYEQSNGYAHALDIRTIGHSEFRNFLMKTYFKILGFNTLRHSVSGPSGDHLHISLMSHDRPHFY